MPQRTAVVVGGGIGGMATAAGLVRAGWKVTVLEQADRIAPVGAGIALAPNAVRALDWLGVGDQLRTRGMAQGAVGLRTPSGRWSVRASAEELQKRFGVPSFLLHRFDVHEMLLDAAAGAEVRTGRRVTSVGAHDGVVTCDGDSVAADVVVAADGVHSELRHKLFPDHPGASYAGYIAWRGVVPANHLGHDLRPSLSETWGRGRRFGLAPLGDGGVYWYATLTAPEHAHDGDTLDDLASRYRGWHAPVPQVLASVPPDALLRNPVYHLDHPLPRYDVGRVALLGDAAHALTPDLGQGACQALEDAVTLAGLLSTDRTVESALTAYDEARRARTQRLGRLSAQVSRIAESAGPLTTRVRDTLAWLVPNAVYLRSTTDAFSWTPPVRAPEPARA